MKFEEKTRLTIDRLITCDAEIMSGTPVFKNTRVPIKNLIDYLETGESLDDFLEDFPSVSREQAVQTLVLARGYFDFHIVLSCDPSLMKND